MRTLTAVLLSLLLGALFASALDCRHAIAQGQTARGQKTNPYYDLEEFFKQTFLKKILETMKKAEEKRLSEREKRLQESRKREELKNQKRIKKIQEEIAKARDAEIIIEDGYGKATWALVNNDKEHFDKWLAFLRNVRDRRFKNKYFNLHADLAAALLETLPLRFIPNVAYIRGDGTVAADPDTRIRAALRREGDSISTAAGGGEAAD